MSEVVESVVERQRMASHYISRHKSQYGSDYLLSNCLRAIWPTLLFGAALLNPYGFAWPALIAGFLGNLIFVQFIDKNPESDYFRKENLDLIGVIKDLGKITNKKSGEKKAGKKKHSNQTYSEKENNHSSKVTHSYISENQYYDEDDENNDRYELSYYVEDEEDHAP